MMDQKMQPYLIEVNHSPSFTCDTPFDLKIKSTLVRVHPLIDKQLCASALSPLSTLCVNYYHCFISFHAIHRNTGRPTVVWDREGGRAGTHGCTKGFPECSRPTF